MEDAPATSRCWIHLHELFSLRSRPTYLFRNSLVAIGPFLVRLSVLLYLPFSDMVTPYRHSQHKPYRPPRLCDVFPILPPSSNTTIFNYIHIPLPVHHTRDGPNTTHPTCPKRYRCRLFMTLQIPSLCRLLLHRPTGHISAYAGVGVYVGFERRR
jgi:hypothetical protein